TLTSISERLKRAVINIVDSYDTCEKTTKRLNVRLLPSREAVVSILAAVQELIFPGYFGISGLDESNISARTHGLVHGLYEDLTAQIELSFDVEDCAGKPDEYRERSESHALEFIEKIPHLRRALSLDVQAAYDGDPAARSYSEIIFSYPGIYAVMVYRTAH